MGTVIIQDSTTENPISLIGKESGICYGSNTEDAARNFQRGLDCIKSNHGRTLEFPQIYMVIDGYSARVARELYTHLSGAPTRLQASTRYIKYGDFDYIIPLSILNNKEAETTYNSVMSDIQNAYKKLQELGVNKEDIANILPLGMTTKVVMRTNLRQLMDMSRQRMCTRAYWEFRIMMKDIIDALADYSEEWDLLINELNVFHPKCDEYGKCTESKGCGKY